MNIKHSLNNVKIKDLLLFILLFVITFSIIIKRNVYNYDELWNYSFAQNIKNGLIPYKDFNMIQMKKEFSAEVLRIEKQAFFLPVKMKIF